MGLSKQHFIVAAKMIVDEWNRVPLEEKGALSFQELASYKTFVRYFYNNNCNFDVHKFDAYIIKYTI